MKVKYSFLIIGCLLLLVGCGKNTNKLDLSGTVVNASSGTIYLQRYENKSFFTLDSAQIVDGKFKFEKEVNLPEIYGLAIDNSGNPFHSFLLLLDNHPTVVKLDTIHEFKNTVVIGSKEQDLLNELSGKFKTPVNEILKAHPSSLAALYVFYRYYSYRLSPQEIRGGIQLLDTTFLKTPYVKVLEELANNLEKVAVGSKVPDFQAQTKDGKKVKLSDYLGRGYVLIDFWASWCVPCRKESPDLVNLYQKYKDKGLEIVGVSLDNHTQPWAGAIEKDGLVWTQLIDPKAWAGEGVKTTGVRLIPYKFLIDKDGIIVAKNLRGEDLDKLVASYLVK